MKLYVIPTENLCNARCAFCITKYRHYKNNFLNLDRLKEILSKNNFEKIEITGGGEPSLHPKINSILDVCTQKCPTQIYTNGHLILSSKPKNLIYICLSRAHYDDDRNQQIMSVRYDLNKFLRLHVPLKFSLLVHRSGISTPEGIWQYILWAKDKAQKIVIRQLFSYDLPEYQRFYEKEFVPIVNLSFRNLNGKLVNGNMVYEINGVEVEIEQRSCACENIDPVLHASGRLAPGWES